MTSIRKCHLSGQRMGPAERNFHARCELAHRPTLAKLASVLRIRGELCRVRESRDLSQARGSRTKDSEAGVIEPSGRLHPAITTSVRHADRLAILRRYRGFGARDADCIQRATVRFWRARMTQPQPNPPGAWTPSTSPKKTGPLVWIPVGCSVIVFVGAVSVAVIVSWGYHTAKSYAERALDTNAGEM